MTPRGITATVCGRSRNGAVSFGEDSGTIASVTSTVVRTLSRSMETAFGAVRRYEAPVPRSNFRNASSAVNTPETPGDGRVAISGRITRTCIPVACRNAANTASSGPAGMLNRCVPACPAAGDDAAGRSACWA